MSTKSSGLGGWDMAGPGDLRDVTIPEHMGRSREVETGPNDTQAQHKAAAQLGYQLHGIKCNQCGEAQSESDLCGVGKALYQRMRDAGVVE